jgi:hypothetical protein
MYLFDYENELGVEDESSNINLFGNYSRIISLNENSEIKDIFPFNESQRKIMSKMENKKIFYTLKKNIDKRRKEREDNIRKKIKSNFHKKIFKLINEKLKKAGAKLYFQSLPQYFISDITKKTNFDALEINYKDLFEYTHEKFINNKIVNSKIEVMKRVSEKKYRKNIETLNYLDNNLEISEKSGWSKIKSMKYIDLLEAYFNSKEFEESIEKLEKKETKNYINDYIYYSLNYIEHFKSYRTEDLHINISSYNNYINNSNTNSIYYNSIITTPNSLSLP